MQQVCGSFPKMEGGGVEREARGSLRKRPHATEGAGKVSAWTVPAGAGRFARVIVASCWGWEGLHFGSPEHQGTCAFIREGDPPSPERRTPSCADLTSHQAVHQPLRDFRGLPGGPAHEAHGG